MLQLPEKFVLFDTEYTAWSDSKATDWGGPNEHREIIQIGAIGVDLTAFSETDAFSAFVRPLKNPQLSGFIIELTGITQSDVDSGASFSDVFTRFSDFVGTRPAYCWGRDVDVFDENCLLTGETRRLPREQYHDLKPIIVPSLEARGIDEVQYSSGTLYRAFDLPETRKAHDALNDMRNLLDALRALSA